MTKRDNIPHQSESLWRIPVLTQALGYSGVLPFIFLAMAIGLQPQQQLWQQLLAGYALAILCFLLGAWWAIALLRRFNLESAIERFGIQQVFELKTKNGCF